MNSEFDAAMSTEEALLELWAYHQIFRRYGFTPSQIFIEPHVLSRSGYKTAGVTVKRDGREFTVDLGRLENREALVKAWPAFLTSANEMDDDVLERMWESARATKQTVGLVTALVAKGFVVRDAKALRHAN